MIPKNVSAKALHESVKEKAVLHVAKIGKTMECPTCKGKGELPISIFDIYNKKLNRLSVSKCTTCKRGKISSYDYYYQKFLTCECKVSTLFNIPEDGKDIFGQDIYICSICSLVKHFG
jgi:hypothetical protein